MPRDRKESDVPNDSEDESSSEDSSGSDSGSSTTDSNASESDPKKASGERHDVSLKTGSPGSAGRSTKVSSSGRGKERTGDSRPDHGCDNHTPKAISREKTDEKAKGRDTEGDVSSDGEQMTRSGPRSTIVQKSSVARKDEGTERCEESSKWTSFKEPEKRDREHHGEEREGQRRRRSRSRSPKTRDSSRGKDHRGRDEKSRKLGNSRKHDGRRQEERQQDYDRSRRDREAYNRKRERDEGNAENERSRHDREASGQKKIRAEGRQDSDRLRRDRDREIGRQVRDDGRKERDGPNTRSDDRDRWHDREPGEGNDDKENHREDNTSRKRQAGETEQAKEKEEMGQPAEKKAKTAEEELLTSRTGGAYIPPARLRMLQAQITDKSSVAYQRMAWEALKKSINGLINKVNVSNIVDIVRELFQENIVRGRGLLGRSVIQAQAASPTFTHVYAALVAIINTKFPQIGELILQRLILQFKRGYRRNDKNLCMASTRFIGHLVNQQVAHEVISLEILTLLLENISEDSVEVAISFLKECGQKLSEVSPKGINAIFERLRSILHEGQIDKRVQYMVEVMFAIRKDDFKDHPAVIADLDLVEEDDQFTHLLTLEDVTTAQDELNVFRADDRYLENEEKYKTLKKEILAEGSSDEDSGDEDSASESSSEEEEEEEEGKQDIIDNTETNMVALRRTIYLTIQSSLDFEECAHKLLKMEMKPGQEVELCYMILDCCAQLRTYEKFFGLLAQRFCQLDKKYVEPYQNIFREQFETIHRLDTNKLRNVAKFFGHLLHTDAISWGVMSCMKLTEEDTTSASRIFIKILFIELAEYMGLPKLNARLRDPTLQEYFEGIMPRNNPKDTRFAINFFTTIGLGGLTEDLREHLKGLSKQLMQQKQQQQQDQVQSTSTSDSSESGSSDSGSSDSSESDSSDSDTSESDSESSDSSSESEADKKRKKKDLRQDSSSRMLQERRETSRRDLAREQQDAISVNGMGRADGRPRIEDKLLRLSLGGEAPTIDFSHTHAASNPPQDRSKRGNRQKGKRGFRNKRQGRRNRRLSAADSSARGRRNSDCDHWANSSYDGHNSDRDRGDVGMEREYYRGDRMPRDDRISSRPRTPDMDSRRDRRYLASEDVMLDRRGRRRDVDISPRADRAVDMRSPRRDHRDVDGSSPRRDRRPIDMSPRHVDSRDVLSPRRRGRADVLSPTGRGLESSPRRGVREPGSISSRGDRRDITSPRLADRRDYDMAPSRRDRREAVSPGRGDHESSPLARDGRRERMDIYRREGDRSPPLGSRNEQKQLEHSRNGSRRGGAEHYSHNDGRSIAKSVSPNPVRESRKEKKRSKEREGTARRQSVSPDSSDHQKHSGHRDRQAVSSRTKDRRRR